jgi:diguanylate cyclase (GGDEF)-like protein
MPLRVRLAIAFSVILLGPVLLLGLALGRGVADARSADLSRTLVAQANSAVRAQVLAECDRLAASARALAVSAAVQHRTDAVTPATSWALCGDAPQPGRRYTTLAARAAVGAGSGWAYAVRPVDAAFLARLSTAAGLAVSTVDASMAVPALGPLPLKLGPVPAGRATSATPVLLAAAITALLASAAFGAWLAALTTRPLRHLASSLDQAAWGDLTRPPRLAGRDEIGHIARRLDHFLDALQESRRQAVTDPLTGLGNRRRLAESLRLETERATRFRRRLGVLVLDLDHFKAVNDTYGHRVGDAVLTEFARRIRGVVREVDLAFRQGGEEFVILLPETDIAGSLTAARRLGDAVRDEPFAVGDLRLAVTVSIGVAVYPRHAATGPDVLEAADSALYSAKDAGRDTFAVAPAGLLTHRAGPTAAVPPGDTTGLPVGTAGLPGGMAGGASVRTACTQIPSDG